MLRQKNSEVDAGLASFYIKSSSALWPQPTRIVQPTTSRIHLVDVGLYHLKKPFSIVPLGCSPGEEKCFTPTIHYS